MASSAQGRQELIRTFAETGLRDLMLLCHELTAKHNTKEQVNQTAEQGGFLSILALGVPTT